MNAREKPPSALLAFAMEIHTLWTSMGIKLIEIDTNKTYIASSLASENIIIIGLLCLGMNPRQIHKHLSKLL